ncbi:protein rdm16 [Quercus suber]|uniref:Protein rdm16 n=1 Tax=Quercus suber TaxID=58331 RepID=A0AAW0K7A9_QUESU
MAAIRVANDLTPAITFLSGSKETDEKADETSVSLDPTYEVQEYGASDTLQAILPVVGTSSATGKSGSLSLDALAKAKKALQMQKELSEKLKKIPLLNKGASTSSEARSMLGLNEEPKAQSVSTGTGKGPVLLTAPTSVSPGLISSSSTLPVASAAADPGASTGLTANQLCEHVKIIFEGYFKKEAFHILKPEVDVDPDSNPHFDERMGINKTKLLRPKRMNFQFVEEGKWSKDAEHIKLKKAKQAQLAKAKAAPDINPNLIEVAERVITKEKPKDPFIDSLTNFSLAICPYLFRDVPLLQSGTYGDITDRAMDNIKLENITIYGPIKPLAEPAPPPPQSLKLTKIQLGLKRKSGVQQLNVSPQTRFKVDVNAQENRLSGCACCGEGGHKSIKRYGKVMLKRINWASAVKEENEDEDESDDKPPNKCVLVWQGKVSFMYRLGLGYRVLCFSHN